MTTLTLTCVMQFVMTISDELWQHLWFDDKCKTVIFQQSSLQDGLGC